MKKVFELFLALAMLLALSACGAKKESVDIIGAWELSEENDIETIYVDFGSSVRQFGAEMNIGNDGNFEFFLGLTGGEGSYAESDGGWHIDYKDYNEGQDWTAELRVEKEEPLTLALSFDGYTVLWTKAE